MSKEADIEIELRQRAAQSEEAWLRVAAVETSYPFDKEQHAAAYAAAQDAEAAAVAATERLSRMIEERNR